MDWERDLPSWSFPELSDRVVCAGHRWHVQSIGTGPDLLLLPGAGASTHTWRKLIPDLAKSFTVHAIDLPGQGFTQSPNAKRSGLDEMAEDILALCAHQAWNPQVIIGHSAGAAIALRMAPQTNVSRIVGINPALDNFEGVAGWLFPFLAKLLAANPFTANLFTLGASTSRAKRLIEGTGSQIDTPSLDFYRRLISDKAHVNGALQMMARWNLDPLFTDLAKIETSVLFLTGENDRAVPPNVAEDAAAAIRNCKVISLPSVGHLAHEEAPDLILSKIVPFLTA